MRGGVVVAAVGAAILCRLGESFAPSESALRHSAFPARRFAAHVRTSSPQANNEPLSADADEEVVRINDTTRTGAVSDADADTEQRHLRFSGVGRLYASGNEPNARSHLDIVDKLGQSTCVVFGVGGVGAAAAEAICRSGVGNIILVDMDEICVSNINRQLHATTSTIGKAKTQEMERRLMDINPSLNSTQIFDFVTLDNINDVMDMLPRDAICLDCIDGQREKAALIVGCYERGMPIVTCGGAAGRKDPTKILCGDLANVQDDRLLFSCRKLLRKKYGWPKGPQEGEKNNHKVKPWGIHAVFSNEKQKSIDQRAGGQTSSLRRCDGALGTACFVTGTYGFVAASRAIDMIAYDKRVVPVKPNSR